MERFVIGLPRTVLSYFLEDSDQSEPAVSTRAPRSTRLVPSDHGDPEEPEERQSALIFCDGSCFNNGRRGARAGYGVSVVRNGVEVVAVSEALRIDEPQTNQRAELRGLAVALQHAGIMASAGATTVRIYTDSEYAINCLTKWIPGWKRSGWKRQTGEPVLHRDILEPLHDAWTSLRGVAFLEHVAAHTGRGDVLSKGNERADTLARASLTRGSSF
jgi:ribonuclease HI